MAVDANLTVLASLRTSPCGQSAYFDERLYTFTTARIFYAYSHLFIDLQRI